MTAPRRRTSFGLWMLFALMTAPCCWLDYQVHWIRQRHNFLQERKFEHAWQDEQWRKYTHAPGLLWLFGERGQFRLFLKPTDDLFAACWLFPEAQEPITYDCAAAACRP